MNRGNVNRKKLKMTSRKMALSRWGTWYYRMKIDGEAQIVQSGTN